jgi:CheY-like chemotaxis protein
LPFPSTPCCFYEALDGSSEKNDKSEAETVLDRSFAEKYPLKILVAEDNMINQALIGSILDKLGYKPDLVENGIEACSMCGQEIYDLVFMDIQMPEMDGITAASTIKQTFGEQAPRIIALTANTSIEKDPKKNIELDDFLSKPFQFKDFLSRLKDTHTVRQEQANEA